MTINPVKRYREKKEIERAIAIETSNLEFHFRTMEIISNMSKAGKLHN